MLENNDFSFLTSSDNSSIFINGKRFVIFGIAGISLRKETAIMGLCRICLLRIGLKTGIIA